MYREIVGILLLAAAGAALAQEAESPRDEIEPAVTELAPLEIDEDPAPQPEQVARRARSESGVMDELDLERTEITGNQELPKVLYIVPWQKSDPGDLMGRPANTLLDEVLAPIDRSEFVREVRYFEDLQDE